MSGFASNLCVAAVHWVCSGDTGCSVAGLLSDDFAGTILRMLGVDPEENSSLFLFLSISGGKRSGVFCRFVLFVHSKVSSPLEQQPVCPPKSSKQPPWTILGDFHIKFVVVVISFGLASLCCLLWAFEGKRKRQTRQPTA